MLQLQHVRFWCNRKFLKRARRSTFFDKESIWQQFASGSTAQKMRDTLISAKSEFVICKVLYFCAFFGLKYRVKR